MGRETICNQADTQGNSNGAISLIAGAGNRFEEERNGGTANRRIAMNKIGLTAVLIAATLALVPAGAFAGNYQVFGTSNRHYYVTVPDRQEAPVNAHRYYGGPKSTVPHGWK
jgi:hypothetical protein